MKIIAIILAISSGQIQRPSQSPRNVLASRPKYLLVAAIIRFVRILRGVNHEGLKNIQGVPVNVIPLNLEEALNPQTKVAPAGGGMSFMANQTIAETQNDNWCKFTIIETGSSWKMLKDYSKVINLVNNGRHEFVLPGPKNGKMNPIRSQRYQTNDRLLVPKIRDALISRRIVILCGQSGTGKTELAKKSLSNAHYYDISLLHKLPSFVESGFILNKEMKGVIIDEAIYFESKSRLQWLLNTARQMNIPVIVIFQQQQYMDKHKDILKRTDITIFDLDLYE